jgi:3-oxoacyl-[acyl-carrier-protein] synthase-3
METMIQKRCVRLISSGTYLPKERVETVELAKKYGYDPQKIISKIGVYTRYFSKEESIAEMAAHAVKRALKKASLDLDSLDLLISASGTYDKPIPHNSVLIHHELKLPSHTMVFDIDCTCLSFFKALDVASTLVEAGQYKRVAIVSSERPSVGLNWDTPESSFLLGDGAVCFILEASQNSFMLHSEYETYSQGIHLAEIPAGGSVLPPKAVESVDDKRFLFKMDGHQIHKLGSKHIESMYARFMDRSQLTIDKIQMVIPHQASFLVLKIVRRKLKIPEEKYFINIQNRGNLVGASIPFALHEAILEKRIKRGDNIVLMGAGAGITLGLFHLIY